MGGGTQGARASAQEWDKLAWGPRAKGIQAQPGGRPQQWQRLSLAPTVWAHSSPRSSVLAAQLPLVAGEGSPNSVALQPGGRWAGEAG